MITNSTLVAWPKHTLANQELLLERLAMVHLGAVVIAEDTTDLHRLIKDGGNPEHDLDRLCDDVKTLLKQAERARNS